MKKLNWKQKLKRNFYWHEKQTLQTKIKNDNEKLKIKN